MNKLEKYFACRQGLIDQYIKGDMSKSEYLERNLDAVLGLNVRPFQSIDSVEKGLFNYQYYNAMAKEAKVQSDNRMHYELKKEVLEQANYYYQKKDKATLEVLNILGYNNVSAYFIHVHSKYLKGRLFEIIINKYDMVLHSKSALILSRLREERVFEEGTKISVIDGYINQKY
ncbi:MAG: hypothetical protein LBU77_05565 [Clostridiales bacterium]|nr:hypothetical protein [Clostridiales bacterium]